MKVNIEEKKKKTGKSKAVQYQNIKNRICQKTAIALISAVLCRTAFLPVLAAEPTVSVDETMYVNLDPYGHQETVNVVKGVTTNGVKQFTDYGNYSKVINMSSHVLNCPGPLTSAINLTARRQRLRIWQEFPV